jgi:hypothetical protein
MTQEEASFYGLSLFMLVGLVIIFVLDEPFSLIVLLAWWFGNRIITKKLIDNSW